MRLATEILTIAHGSSNAVRLSPSLRAGLHLQRTHGLGKIAQALDQTNVSVILDIVDAGTGNDPAGRKIVLDTIAAHGVLGLLAFRPTLEAFVITSFGITADDHPAERKEPRRHKPLPFEDWFTELFGMGTGGLGWTPAETWAATPAEISVAYAAKMRTTYGDPDADEQPHDDGELSPEELRANIEKLRSSVRRGKK